MFADNLYTKFPDDVVCRAHTRVHRHLGELSTQMLDSVTMNQMRQHMADFIVHKHIEKRESDFSIEYRMELAVMPIEQLLELIQREAYAIAHRLDDDWKPPGTPRTHPDVGTVAYIAIGAHKAIAAAPGGVVPEAVSVEHGGQNGFITDVAAHALTLDTMADEKNNEFSAVFDYEVAEPFGYQIAEAMIAGVDFDVRAIAANLIEKACR